MILITGSEGQLGKDICSLFNPEEVILVDLKKGDKNIVLDITNEKETIKTIMGLKPDLIIHPAAYTDVDGCETNKELAFKVNGEGTRNLCIAAASLDIPLFYVSTDYVFDGESKTPYKEDDPINPQSVYGQSKAEGEKHVKAILSKYFIGRTAWLYGWHGNNFVKTISKLAQERSELKVVDDQIGSPTFSNDLASKIKEIALSDKYGTYHLTNTGQTSWYGFTLEILKYAGINAKIEPCTSDEYHRPAPRPAYSVLDNGNLIKNGFAPIRSWQEGLKSYFQGYERKS
jgi:dTDP-4-dehydrorhamnose reductase